MERPSSNRYTKQHEPAYWQALQDVYNEGTIEGRIYSSETSSLMRHHFVPHKIDKNYLKDEHKNTHHLILGYDVYWKT
jgi:hypothetical protein